MTTETTETTETVVTAETAETTEVFQNERVVEMVEFELDLENELIEKLLAYAKENIVNDTKALINWAVNDALMTMIKKDAEKEEEK